MIGVTRPRLTALDWFAVTLALLLLTCWFLYDFLVQTTWVLAALIAFGL